MAAHRLAVSALIDRTYRNADFARQAACLTVQELFNRVAQCGMTLMCFPGLCVHGLHGRQDEQNGKKSQVKTHVGVRGAS